MKYTTPLLETLILFAFSCKSGNQQSGMKKASGEEWMSLFDGETLEEWRSFNSDTIYGWTVEKGYLTALGEGGDPSGDIITEDEFGSFELNFEWKDYPDYGMEKKAILLCRTLEIRLGSVI